MATYILYLQYLLKPTIFNLLSAENPRVVKVHYLAINIMNAHVHAYLIIPFDSRFPYSSWSHYLQFFLIEFFVNVKIKNIIQYYPHAKEFNYFHKENLLQFIVSSSYEEYD